MSRNTRHYQGKRAAAVLALAGVAALASAAPAFAALPAIDETQLVSVNTGGVSSSAPVSTGVVSANGRYVVFSSTAQDLVTFPASTGGNYDVFRRDLLTGETVLVSFDSTGLLAGNAGSGAPAISADGRYVVFDSTATNMHPLDTSTDDDIFLRDMDLGITTLVSINATGTASGDDYSGKAAISGDGSIVSFTSRATNLVAVDTNGVADVFFRTVSTDTPETALVSLRSLGDQTALGSGYGPASLSFDGRYIAFDSGDQGILPSGSTGDQIYRKDLITNELRGISYNLGGTSGPNAFDASISADGALVAFSSTSDLMDATDTNGVEDVYVRSLIDDSLTRISVPNPAAGGTPGDSIDPWISADGRFVAFDSEGTDLVTDPVTGNGDIYVYSLAAGTTSLVSRSLDGTGGAVDTSSGASLSGDGSAAAFDSSAADLTANDTNGQTDMFVRGLPVPAPTTDGPALAATGFDPLPLAALAVGLLLTGNFALRRRTAR